MLEVFQTDQFARWFTKLKDRNARARIQARIDRLELGHIGDAESVGGGVSEMRIFYGPGYRVYFTRRSSFIVVLLIGGDKSTQSKDIRKAIRLARELEN
ncbi:MAG: type II toxin-antitoxin system RelE/ParE family toxin [Pseudohongiellaceae bacterium]|jgi:putative addiction module killer protein